jgi:hypothetical protein
VCSKNKHQNKPKTFYFKKIKIKNKFNEKAKIKK